MRLNRYTSILFWNIRSDSKFSPCAYLIKCQVDPFLRLIEDGKLQAVITESGFQKNAYGSEEDDNSALQSLSHIQLTEDQTRAFLASGVLKSLGDLPEVKALFLYSIWNCYDGFLASLLFSIALCLLSLCRPSFPP